MHGEPFISGHWIWWTLVSLLVICFIWALAQRPDRSEASESPEQVLKRRYANGEIDTEEYEQRLAEIRK